VLTLRVSRGAARRRRHHAIEAALDGHWALAASGPPAGGSLQLGEDLVETRRQSGDDVVGISGAAMPGLDCSRRSADERCIREDALEARGGS